MPPQRPVVVIVDDEERESFRELAGALRRRGLRVRRVVPPGSPRPKALGRFADWLVYGRSDLLAAPVEEASPVGAAERRMLLSRPTVDVHAPEHIAARTVMTQEWRDLQGKVRPDLPPDLVFDKFETTRFAESVGVGVPRTWTTPTTDTFPVVVKGRQGYGGRNVRIAHDQPELDHAWAELADLHPFLQSFHPGGVTSTGGVARDGRIALMGAWRVFPDPHEPLGPPASIRPVDEPDLLEATERLIGGLGYTGMFNLNFVRDEVDGRPLLIDLNCRVFGSWQAVEEAGIDVVGAYVSVFGQAPPPSAPHPAYGQEFQVVRLGYVAGDTWSELAGSASDMARVVWGRRRVLGWRWVVSQELRLSRRAGREASRLLRGR